MAKRKERPALAEFKAVVQVPLLETMVASVATLILSPDQVRKEFDELVEFGLITSVSPDALGGYQVSIRQSRVESPNAGLMFFSKAPTVLEAKAVALVKVHFLDSQGDWLNASEKMPTTRYR